MKILKIELKNLNSLRGKWTIDLSDKIYESNGIFAITGSTGAGKTTIFDAVCLALYGQTPRLGKITKSQNEIMSRKTKECYAKVEFETDDGEKYLSAWEQHCAGKNDKLQDPSHILSYAEGGEIIASGVKDTQEKIRELTGFDFQRFRQAVMLEQGGFDAFLKANKNERAEILESLTGTEIYREISKKVYERAKIEENKLGDIDFQRENKKPDDDFQNENEILDAIAEAKKNLESVTAAQNDAKIILDWLKGIQKLENDLAENEKEIFQLNKRFELFTADSRRLEIGQRAAELAGDFSELKAKRENYQRLQINAEKLKKEISGDSAIILKIENEDLPGINQEIQEMKKNFLPEESPESFCGIAKERVKNFTETSNRQKEIENKKADCEKKFNSIKNNFNSAEENQKKFQAICNEAEKKINEIWNSRNEVIFEIERQKLKPGTPCPICGSTEHPYKLKIRNEKLGINNLDDAMNLARINFDKARKDLDRAKENSRRLEADLSTTRANLDNTVLEFNKISDQRAEEREKISELIGKLNISVKFVREIIPAIDNWLVNLKNLEEKLKRLNENKDSCKVRIETRQNSLNQAISEIENSKNELDSLEKNFADKLREKNFENEKIFTDSIIDADEIKKLNSLKQELENDKNKLFGIKNNFEKKLAAEKEKSLTQEKFEEIDSKFKTQEEFIKNLNKKITSFEIALENRKKLIRELEKLNKEYEKQAKISSNWNELSNLIGSSKGDKFRVFAQKMTLSKMIELANEQLEKMNGRYVLLVRPDSDELELSVIDKEQAGEIRPTENLSGGERFIISLALALGLSGLSGNKSRVDSLFLDEGFGSLDEEALNTALEALAELHLTGRTIGIISHVAALRERIAAQIEVIHKSSGTSIIKGPGVFN